jgi:hypothetical protein
LQPPTRTPKNIAVRLRYNENHANVITFIRLIEQQEEEGKDGGK